MNIQQAISQILKIEAGEGKLLVLILVQAFLQNVLLNFLYAVAFALFLTEFDAQTIPLVYIANAFLAALVTFVYLKIGERGSFTGSLSANFGFQAVVLVCLWVGLMFGRAAWLVFLTAIAYELFNNIGALPTWQIAGRVFNVRQGKRLFGTIGVSEWMATIIAGLLVGPLVALMGLENMLLLCAFLAAGLLVVLYFLNRDFSKLLTGHKPAMSRNTPAAPPSIRDLLSKRYILLILSIVFFWYLAFYFIDNIFFVYVEIQYTDEASLAGFLGIFWSIVGVGAVLGNVLAGRLISWRGVRAVVRYLPTAFIVLSVLAFILIISQSVFTSIFAVVALIRLLMSSAGFSIDRRARDILYQPLPIRERNRALTLSEGFVRSVASGLAGGVLLLLVTLLPGNTSALLIGFLFLSGAWLIIAIVLGGDYPKAVALALNQRLFDRQTTVDLNDRRIIRELQTGLQSAYAEVVIYSLELLSKIHPQYVISMAPELLRHPTPEVRIEALTYIAHLNVNVNLDMIRAVIQDDEDAQVRGKAVETLAAVGQTAVFSELADLITHKELAIRTSALSNLLRHGGIEGVLLAGQALLYAVESAKVDERVMAAEVLGKVGIHTFYKPLIALLNDPETEVQQAAIQAAGQIRSEVLWPQLIPYLEVPANRPLAVQALSQGGRDVLPLLSNYISDTAKPSMSRGAAAQICGRIGGAEAIQTLRPLMGHPHREVRTQVLLALKKCAYQATEAAERQEVDDQIKAEFETAAWLLAIWRDCEPIQELPAEVALLHDALNGQINYLINHLFMLFGFLYDADKMAQAQFNYQLPSAEMRAYALEIIELELVDPLLKQVALPLLSGTRPRQKQQGLQHHYPHPPQSVSARLEELITTADTRISPWTKTCTLHLIGLLGLDDLQVQVASFQTSTVSLLRKTAVTSLRKLQALDHTSGEPFMLSIIERVLILKTVNLFANTPPSVLANVADLLEERHVAADEPIFAAGDVGDSMYVVVAGKVMAHTGSVFLNYLEQGEVFGEMALLDAETRSASITAVEPTLLLRLDQSHFYELLAEHHEFARGILQVISRQLRNRVRDINEVRQQLHALEGKGKGG